MGDDEVSIRGRGVGFVDLIDKAQLIAGFSIERLINCNEYRQVGL